MVFLEELEHGKVAHGIYIPSTSSSASPPGLQAQTQPHGTVAPTDIVGDAGARVISSTPSCSVAVPVVQPPQGVSPGRPNPLTGLGISWALTILNVLFARSVRLDQCLNGSCFETLLIIKDPSTQVCSCRSAAHLAASLVLRCPGPSAQTMSVTDWPSSGNRPAEHLRPWQRT